MTGISGGDPYGYTPGTVPGTLQGQANKEAWERQQRAPNHFNPWQQQTNNSTVAPYRLPFTHSPASTSYKSEPVHNDHGYHKVTFDCKPWMRLLGLSPRRTVSEAELKVCRALFGNHSAQFVRQTRQSAIGRQSFLLADGQVIQRPGPDEPAAKSNGLTLFFRNTLFSRMSVRALVDALESRGAQHGFELERCTGTAIFKSRLTAAFAQERMRRLQVARKEAAAWKNRLRAAEATTVQADFMFNLAERVDSALSSNDLEPRTISAVYHQFEPWGASQPSSRRPDWRRLAVILGVELA